jgi:Lar family restriction alleviation protein
MDECIHNKGYCEILSSNEVKQPCIEGPCKNETRLLPCPFCGGEAFVATIEHSNESRPNGYRYHGDIMCKICQASCGTTGFDETYTLATEKAIKAWNRRAT